MGFTADHQRMASAAFVIEERKHIDLYRELKFVQMDIVRLNWVRECVHSCGAETFVL